LNRLLKGIQVDRKSGCATSFQKVKK
jgi:hypothetical protein